MEYWILYATVALAVSLTSYLNIYKPALELYKEVTEDEKPIIGTLMYKLVWIVLAFAMAPFIAVMLAKGRNDNYIRDLVVAWISSDEE